MSSREIKPYEIDWEKYRRNCDAYADRRLAEATAERQACARGDCRYACRGCQPPISDSGKVGNSGGAGLNEGPPYTRHDHVCHGYWSSVNIEHGQSVIRTGLCPRQTQWWKEARIKIRQRKAQVVETKKLASKAWGE